jgi:hypothetical protein
MRQKAGSERLKAADFAESRCAKKSLIRKLQKTYCIAISFAIYLVMNGCAILGFRYER